MHRRIFAHPNANSKNIYSVAVARLRVFTQPRPIASFSRPPIAALRKVCSITSSARLSNAGATLRPSAAVVPIGRRHLQINKLCRQASSAIPPSLLAAAADRPCRCEALGQCSCAHHLALLWQIYSCRYALQIDFRQCGQRVGGGRAKSLRMAWRTAGKVGCGGGPLILFFPLRRFEAAVLQESIGDHRHQRMTGKTLPGSSFEVIKAEFFFHLLVSLLAYPSRLDGGRQGAQIGRRRQIGEVIFFLSRHPMFADEPSFLARQMLLTLVPDPLWWSVGDPDADSSKPSLELALCSGTPADGLPFGSCHQVFGCPR